MRALSQISLLWVSNFHEEEKEEEENDLGTVTPSPPGMFRLGNLRPETRKPQQAATEKNAPANTAGTHGVERQTS